MRHPLRELAIGALMRVQRLLNSTNDRALRASLGHCGRNVVIRQPAVIETPQYVFIDDDVSIASFLHIWGNAGVRIGSRTMIASHVAIATATHDPDAIDMYRSLVEYPVVIEHDVWIGAHAVIMPGVRIGAHSIVAAASVVRHDVAAGTIVAGVPARYLRQRGPFNDRVQRASVD
jgi:maltose O-acetyltransferase